MIIGLVVEIGPVVGTGLFGGTGPVVGWRLKPEILAQGGTAC